MGGATEYPVGHVISIVDDDEASREALAVLIRSLGFAGESFESAAEFLAWPRLPETSCLIADINMPGMTGVELYRHLLRVGCPIPTILITAYPEDEGRARAMADGVIAYLSKPCSERALLGCVQSALQLSEGGHDPT